ncbi:MAG: cyclic nucleotide-binding domain-containing protein [Magnetococcales bacterium]|nr:cyclic nucleotide-binding domain-containing protein [Magnetococcales bacterium]
MKRKSDDLLTKLQSYPPFDNLSHSALFRAGEAIRSFRIHDGERLVLRGGENPDYLYLLHGGVEVRREDRTDRLTAEEQKGKLYFFPAGRKPLEVEAVGDALVCHVGAADLDELVAWDQMARASGIFHTPQEEASLRGIRETRAFRALPFEAVYEAMRRMQRKTAPAGTDIVTQGEPGDAFYLIVEGRLEVWRRGIYDNAQQLAATLGPGDGFGEEALILKGTRNATVRAATPCTLLWLGKADFDELVATPLSRTVVPKVAKAMIENGHVLVDVRYEEEYDESHAPGSQLIPLPDLRRRLKELDPRGRYLVICAAGKRASVAALLMRQHKISDVAVVEGGMRDWPFETFSNI